MSEEIVRYPFVQDFDHYVEMVAGINKSVELVVKPVSKENDVHACFYCDGGAKPHPPMAGWGLHGYFFIDVEPKQGSGCGDAITNHGYAKKGDIKQVTPVGYLDGCGAIVGGTNNAAEAEAVIIGLLAALAGGVRSAAFFCDSKYVLTGCTDRLEKMRAADFTDYQTRQPIPNADRWRIISSLLKSCEEYGIQLSWNWVKGHSDYLGNIKADALASRGILQGRNGHYAEDILLLPGKGYWNPTADYDRFLNEGRWFFQLENGGPQVQVSFTTDDGDVAAPKHTYYLGNSAMDDMDHGVPAGDANFAVVRMPTKDPVLAAVEERTRALRDVHMNEVVVGRLDVLFNPSIYTSIQNSGVAFLHQKNPRRLDLWATDKVAMTQEISPPRKSHIAVCAFRELETLLSHCESILGTAPMEGCPPVTLTEITNCIYETQSTGKKPVLKITSAVDKGDGSVVVPAHNPVNGQAETLSLSIGIDTPKRNMLAAIASDDPKVYLVTWKETDRAYRYATLVKAGERIGIWAAVYSNFKFIALSQS